MFVFPRMFASATHNLKSHGMQLFLRVNVSVHYSLGLLDCPCICEKIFPNYHKNYAMNDVQFPQIFLKIFIRLTKVRVVIEIYWAQETRNNSRKD